ncbi:MAG: hypothetical protein BGO01_12320 [Armatimonadetes bacterium 55-13]|nr:DUF1232 domain-containing protein [Armatimonadota bacterium]OJU61925.1 MAG: hypothetical protein BGO01_12320 [Armatimonadetes bacterium 55-13]
MNLREKAKALKQEVTALVLAMRDSRTPWYAKALGGLVLAYALSPIDLIPDFIPVLGLLDDLILVPLGVALVVRLTPETVLTECREKAKEMGRREASKWGAAFVVLVWLGVASLLIWLIKR